MTLGLSGGCWFAAMRSCRHPAAGPALAPRNGDSKVATEYDSEIMETYPLWIVIGDGGMP